MRIAHNKISNSEDIVFPKAEWFLKELDEYVKNHDFVNGRLFSFKHKTLNRYINMVMRPKIKGNWIIRRPSIKGSQTALDYKFQLKGLRHNFQTLDFASNLEKWGKDMAIEFTSKRMRHSSYKITARHYIQNFEQLGIGRFKGRTMSDVFQGMSQTKLTEFGI